MTAVVHYRHRVRLEEVDAAGVVYFARYFSWCHDAMEAMLAPLDGGYADLVVRRRLGLPAVHVDADYTSPLRFGDEVRISARVERIGTSSCAIAFEIERMPNGKPVARVRHIVALTDLDLMKACPFPHDLRELLERQVATP